jgi:hypothetical protein
MGEVVGHAPDEALSQSNNTAYLPTDTLKGENRQVAGAAANQHTNIASKAHPQIFAWQFSAVIPIVS